MYVNVSVDVLPNVRLDLEGFERVVVNVKKMVIVCVSVYLNVYVCVHGKGSQVKCIYKTGALAAQEDRIHTNFFAQDSIVRGISDNVSFVHQEWIKCSACYSEGFDSIPRASVIF